MTQEAIENTRIQPLCDTCADVTNPWSLPRESSPPPSNTSPSNTNTQQSSSPVLKLTTTTAQYAAYTFTSTRPTLDTRASTPTFADFLSHTQLSDQATLDTQKQRRLLTHVRSRAKDMLKSAAKSAVEKMEPKMKAELKADWDPYPERRRYGPGMCEVCGEMATVGRKVPGWRWDFTEWEKRGKKGVGKGKEKGK
ncbi:hypothetical protein M011DRAFT_475875 [Sporormia fimetaria CBS 119925]|uniref:Uncharacterized protein n=1 Tax=Sporormia fimetaria CBS 119925 TaxID=1340428 RepID=A0A6A6VH54_9PLEO|nr:hypothetical protein M011DRAFT_475875 [Sporormia fimetaria CBS 119925]